MLLSPHLFCYLLKLSLGSTLTCAS